MYETYEYTEKKREKEIKRQQFSANYFGVLLTLGLNILFYVISMVGAYSLTSGNLMIATWPIAGVLLIEIVSVGVAAILEIYKAKSVQNLFKASIFKSIARLTGFIVGVGFVVYGSIAAIEFGRTNAIAVLTSSYGVLSIIVGLPMFIWSIFHLSVVSSSRVESKTYYTKKNDDVVVDAGETSSYQPNRTSNSTAEAIEVEVHDINEA